ncbi:methionine adenosyltransferase [Candidatus Roizmanbacteria bacterium]|nr:methionine adenosyltransferase [Candidatus Roizmanbacteria bacterium]
MPNTRKTYTSESVCAGHPDKICDQISDAILDEALKKDKFSRVAVETLVTKNFIALAGEVTSKAKLNYKIIAGKVIRQLGYTNPKLKFTNKSPIIVKIHTQSPEIAVGVNKLGAGDQGMMYGFATDETKESMPLPIMLAHKLAMKIDELRETKRLPYLRPDGKTQITMSYENGKPVSVETVVIAVPHSEEVKLEQMKEDLYQQLIIKELTNYGLRIKRDQLIVNGTGVWHIGGPASDTGVTGRKIIVDSYGSFAHVGGGAFSGKDPTKVDRSGAYAARFLAKNIVAAGLAKKCEVRLAYFIGAKKPVMQEVETFGTAKKSEKIIKSFMKKILDTSLSGILEGLNLRRPIYFKTAVYGHFGRDGFPWEKIIL